MADGFGIDTSSYPRPVATPPINPLDTMAKTLFIQREQQALQSGQLGISQQQLDLVNQRFGSMAKDFTALANNPNLNEDMIRQRIQTDVKLGIVTPDMAGTFINQLPPTQGMAQAQVASTLKNHLETWLNHAMTIKEALDAHYGQQSTIDTGNAIQPVSISPLTGIRSTGLPIQKQLPPTTPFYPTGSGQQQYVGSNPNAVTMPPTAPGSNISLPVAKPTTGPIGPTVERPDLEPTTFAQRFNAAPPVNFSEGQKAYNEDQALATQKLTAIKPALLALPLMDKIRSGPGTKLWNEGVAGLKAQRIISEGTATTDATAIYEQVNKYMNDYLSRRGGATDAAREQLMRSSPDIGSQINPALRKLTQTAIAQDRIEAARANAFGSRNDYQNYPAFRSTFPPSMDERAFSVDTMNNEEKQKLAKEIQAMPPNQRQRFMNSLKIYDSTKVGPQ